MIDENKLIELQKQIKELNELKDHHYLKLNSLKVELDDLYTMQTKSMVIVSKFSFWEKWITRRDEYKQYRLQTKMAAKVPELIKEKNAEIENEYSRLNQMIEIRVLNNQIDELNKEVQALQNEENSDNSEKVLDDTQDEQKNNVFFKADI